MKYTVEIQFVATSIATYTIEADNKLHAAKMAKDMARYDFEQRKIRMPFGCEVALKRCEPLDPKTQQ
jgi:hypothetical protein